MRLGHYGTPALAACLGALLLLVVHLAVPFGVVDLPAGDNGVGLDDQPVSAGDVASDFDDGRYGLPSPAVAFWGILLALVAGLLLVGLGLAPMGVTAARLAGWGLAALGATGAWLAVASSAYWLGTGFATLLGVLSRNPHESARLWVVSPVLVTAGGLALLWTFLRVATGVVSRRDGLRDDAAGHARVALLGAVLLVGLLTVPWSLQVIDGDERRDDGACPATAVCPGRLDWYSAWGASGGAGLSAFQGDPAGGLFTSRADGLYGGILAVAQNTEAGPGLWQHAAFSLEVLTAAAWTTFFTGTLATLGAVLASAFPAPRAPRATTALHVPALLVLAWATVHYALLVAYQWRPTYDGGVLPDVQSWWSPLAPLLLAPLLVLLGWRQAGLAQPLLSGLRSVARERAETAHTFD